MCVFLIAIFLHYIERDIQPGQARKRGFGHKVLACLQNMTGKPNEKKSECFDFRGTIWKGNPHHTVYLSLALTLIQLVDEQSACSKSRRRTRFMYDGGSIIPDASTSFCDPHRLSLMLCVGDGALWVRQYFVADNVSRLRLTQIAKAKHIPLPLAAA